MSAEAQFFGGPLHMQQRVLPSPAPEWRVPIAPKISFADAAELDEVVTPRVGIYLREEHPSHDRLGTFYRYHYLGERP